MVALDAQDPHVADELLCLLAQGVPSHSAAVPKAPSAACVNLSLKVERSQRQNLQCLNLC